MPNRTPFYDRHVALGGKIIDFHDWELPVQYTTITQEHTAVRTKAGVFDISHMGQVLVWGKDALAFLQYITTNDINRAHEGKGIYAYMLNERGGVIDDIFVFRLEPERFLVVINASRRGPDTAWMQQNSKRFDVDLLEAPFAAGLALQGPAAITILEKLSPQVAQLGHHQIGDFDIGDVNALISRTGYTGEDGFEIFAPAGHLLTIFDQLMSVGQPLGLLPAGLGARDTLRTEVAYPLYGHELDEERTPLEAGLDWVVKLDKGDFIGREALLKQKSEGLKIKLVGFRVDQGGVARPGGKILINGVEKGLVTSGTFSPSLNKAIGMAWMPAETPTEGFSFVVSQGPRQMQAVTTKMPFYKKPVAAKS